MTIFSNGNEHIAYISADQGMCHKFRIGLKSHDIEELNSELQQANEQLSVNLEMDGGCGDSLAKLAQKGNFAFKRIFAEGIPRETIGKALKLDATIQLTSDEFFSVRAKDASGHIR